jgi:tRNA nucleotidyltransferase (CCA-adding enzyme)
VTRPSLEAVRRGVAPATAALLDAVVAEAERADVALHLVGGPVRDLLLGRPLRDVDLIVEPQAERAIGAAELARAVRGARALAHDRFGTVRLSTAEAAIDLATVRSETYAKPGALPSVAPGTLELDLLRRDFTVNALALPLTAAARRGRAPIVDPGTGREDLAAGVLRIFHPRSFHDDPTRALRAARLAARLSFRLARGARSALRDAIADGAFAAVSGDRLRREIERLFEDGRLGLDPAAALRLLDDWHVLRAVEPGLALPAAALAPLRRFGRALAEPSFPGLRFRPWAVGLALWLADLDATSRRRAIRRLSVRGELAARIAEFPKRRDRTLRALARARGRGAADALLAPLDDETLVALAQSAAPALRRRIQRWLAEDRGRRPPVNGADLVAAGLTGPAVGAALARIRLAWLDGALRTREEALALAREVGERSARRPRQRKKAPKARKTAREKSRVALPAPEASPILPPSSPPPTRALHPERS